MKKQPKYLKRKNKRSPIVFVLAFIAFLLFVLVCIMVYALSNRFKTQEVVTLISTTFDTPTELHFTSEATVQLETVAETTDITIPKEEKMLEDMALLCEENPDIFGWLTIDGTKIDYPVMYTPKEPEKYLHLNFEEEYSLGGLPFIDAGCSITPESDNLLIYGHNMQIGTMFHSLLNYEMKNFWESHPIISLKTLYEEREYEVVSAFYDRVYYTYEDCFKFYQFIDAEDQQDFDEAIAIFKEKSLYDTGISASYGDHLITLITCAYHVDNGRFVVVAREKNS